MKEFNLEEAIAGKPIVTRDGKKVLDFHYFEDVNLKIHHPITVLIEGSIRLDSYTRKGTYYTSGISLNDLLMYEEPKTYYANVYKHPSGRPYTGHYFESLEELKQIIPPSNYIKTIEITIP